MNDLYFKGFLCKSNSNINITAFLQLRRPHPPTNPLHLTRPTSVSAVPAPVAPGPPATEGVGATDLPDWRPNLA